MDKEVNPQGSLASLYSFIRGTTQSLSEPRETDREKGYEQKSSPKGVLGLGTAIDGRF